MAFGTKRVYVDQSTFNTGKIPSGGTVSTSAASLGTVDITEDVSFTVSRADFVAATAAAGYDDLFDTELVADIDAYIAAVAPGLGVDTSGNTVSYNARVKSVAFQNLTDIYLNDANANVVVQVELKVYLS